MSYWVSLTYPDGNELAVNSHEEGGTYVAGGSDSAELNVTYNYSKIYHEHGFSLKNLNGLTARETTDRLQSLVLALGVDQDDDYWAATPGNAGHALSVLLGWGLEHPDGIWRVS